MIGKGKSGFSLIELIVVLSIISLMAGLIMPMATAVISGEKTKNVEEELERISKALEAYYYDKGHFPKSLTSVDFYGVYIIPGVDNDWIKDEWGRKNYYRVYKKYNPDIMVVYSVGENGKNDGVSREKYKIIVMGSVPGNIRTREKLSIINAALANFIKAGKTLTGDWTTDRKNLGLGEIYQNDGFNMPFKSDPSTNSVISAGADRIFGTADDLPH